MTSTDPETEPPSETRPAVLRPELPYGKWLSVTPRAVEAATLILAIVTSQALVIVIALLILILWFVGYSIQATLVRRIVVAAMFIVIATAGFIAAFRGVDEIDNVGKALLGLTTVVVAIYVAIATQFDTRPDDVREPRPPAVSFGIALIATAGIVLAGIAGGVGLRVLVDGDGITALTLLGLVIGLGVLSVTILVARRMVVALALFASGPMLLGFGAAATLAGDAEIGFGLLLLGLALTIAGLFTAYGKTKNLGGVLIFAGIVFAVIIAAPILIEDEIRRTSLLFGVIAVTFVAVGSIFVRLSPADPFRHRNDENPWSPRRYAVVALISSVLAAGNFVVMSLLLPDGRTGAGIAVAGLATGLLAVSIVTGIASVRVSRRQGLSSPDDPIRVLRVVTGILFASAALIAIFAAIVIVLLGLAGQPPWLLVVVGFGALLLVLGLGFLGTPGTVIKVTAPAAKVALIVLASAYFVLVAWLATRDPIDTTIEVWVGLGAWVLLVVFDCALIVRLRSRGSPREVVLSGLALVFATSLTGTVVAGLAGGTTGIAFRFLREGELLGSVTLFAEAAGLAALGATLLVARRMVVALAVFATGPLLAGFGLAAFLDHDPGIGVGLLVLGPLTMITGLLIAYAHSIDVGYLMIMSALVAAGISISVAEESSAVFRIPFIGLALSLAATGVLFVRLNPDDPYRHGNDDNPWPAWKYAVVALFGLSIAGAAGTLAFALVNEGQFGSAAALGGIAVASLALGIPTLVATIRVGTGADLRRRARHPELS